MLVTCLTICYTLALEDGDCNAEQDDMDARLHYNTTEMLPCKQRKHVSFAAAIWFRRCPEHAGTPVMPLGRCRRAAVQTRCRRASTRLLATLLPGA